MKFLKIVISTLLGLLIIPSIWALFKISILINFKILFYTFLINTLLGVFAITAILPLINGLLLVCYVCYFAFLYEFIKNIDLKIGKFSFILLIFSLIYIVLSFLWIKEFHLKNYNFIEQYKDFDIGIHLLISAILFMIVWTLKLFTTLKKNQNKPKEVSL